MSLQSFKGSFREPKSCSLQSIGSFYWSDLTLNLIRFFSVKLSLCHAAAFPAPPIVRSLLSPLMMPRVAQGLMFYRTIFSFLAFDQGIACTLRTHSKVNTHRAIPVRYRFGGHGDWTLIARTRYDPLSFATVEPSPWFVVGRSRGRTSSPNTHATSRNSAARSTFERGAVRQSREEACTPFKVCSGDPRKSASCHKRDFKAVQSI